MNCMEAEVLKKIDHIGIAVKNLDEAIKVFVERFGFTAGPIMGGGTRPTKVAMLTAGDIRLELFEPLDPKSDMAKNLEKGISITHLSFSTDDIEKEMSTLKANGARLVQEKPISMPTGKIAFVGAESAENVSIELAQRP